MEDSLLRLVGNNFPDFIGSRKTFTCLDKLLFKFETHFDNCYQMMRTYSFTSAPLRAVVFVRCLSQCRTSAADKFGSVVRANVIKMIDG